MASTTAADCVLSHKCVLNIFNKLANGVSGLTISLGANRDRIKPNEIQMAINKGWIVN